MGPCVYGLRDQEVDESFREGSRLTLIVCLVIRLRTAKILIFQFTRRHLLTIHHISAKKNKLAEQAFKGSWVLRELCGCNASIVYVFCVKGVW